MSQTAGLRSMDARILRLTKRAQQSDLAIFQGAGAPVADCDVYINRGLQIVNADTGRATGNQITLVAFLAQLLEVPARGHTFTVGAEVFTVDSVSDQDESRVTCIVSLDA